MFAVSRSATAVSSAYFHDITERKRTESKLCERQERLKLATENTGLSAWDFDLRTGEGHLVPERL